MAVLQHFKNFKIVSAPKNKDLLADAPPGVLFLESEDGCDWYECQAYFSDDTVKIMYDAAGIIMAVVDKPVPQRGNTYAVSMLWPVNMSVTELALKNYPSGCKADGSWRYSGGKIESIPPDYAAIAESQKSNLMVEANTAITPLQDAIELDIASDEEKVLLLAWKKYRVLLSRIDTRLAPEIDWPEKPAVASTTN